ncbi:GNAT family N-acetyltransferase [Pyxidicoccus fallax]|uniref:GNAT family N-acetyltransferase n=1 Tax=Pyxidicoccus fallax TaxID=394095 RepID=A0A848LZA9_9BACT|nr:GNAT family N-acetyltransferase [Pyxidicoccus fallax]NMO23457.1 GNAT family N-acetyltransferase [Pyxidicoccus fallax]NPC86598.1 GNAT family N-acetyltransferase [Pyxidicoccus fallax]
MGSSDLRLVPARPEHVDYWLVLRAEPGARRFVDTEDDSREGLLKRITEAGTWGEPRAKGFRWFVEHDGRLIGTVSARDLSKTHGRAQLGYMLSDAYHGRGLGTRAVGMMVEQLFTLPFLHRIWLTTLADNLASQAVARKLGFTLEGTMREHSVQLGQRCGLQFWGLLRPEWEARRHG